MASSSRARSSSPFSHNKPSTPHSSASSSTSSFTNGRVMPRSCSSSTSSFYNSGGGGRSMTPSCGHNESVYYGYGNPSLVEFGMDEEVITELIDSSRARDSISVTIRFRPLSEREYHRGDEIAWYADGDKIVRNEYNPAIAYAFGNLSGGYEGRSCFVSWTCPFLYCCWGTLELILKVSFSQITFNNIALMLMTQILLHRTLHSTIYEVDKLQIGGGNFLTKISLLIILQWYQCWLCHCLLQTENKPN
ncbi:Kinesin-like protein KIN-7M, chloroplastic [Glycine soja]